MNIKSLEIRAIGSVSGNREPLHTALRLGGHCPPMLAHAEQAVSRLAREVPDCVACQVRLVETLFDRNRQWSERALARQAR